MARSLNGDGPIPRPNGWSARVCLRCRLSALEPREQARLLLLLDKPQKDVVNVVNGGKTNQMRGGLSQRDIRRIRQELQKAGEIPGLDCPECGRSFSTGSGLARHRGAAHGSTAPARPKPTPTEPKRPAPEAQQPPAAKPRPKPKPPAKPTRPRGWRRQKAAEELRRDPDRNDAEVALLLGIGKGTVKRARTELGLPPPARSTTTRSAATRARMSAAPKRAPRLRCGCGLETTAGPMGRHLKATGHKAVS